MDKVIKVVRVLLVTFFAIWAIILFSIRAYKLSEVVDDVGIINKAMVQLYNVPYIIKHWYIENYKNPLQKVEIEHDKNLYKIGKLSDFKEISNSLYLLHSKYQNNSTTKVQLQNIKNGEVVMEWTIPLNQIMKDIDSIRKDLKKRAIDGNGIKNLGQTMPKNISSILIRSPIYLKDSSLIFQTYELGLIYKIDRNSKFLWKSKRLAHHSLELDENGNIWTCSIDLKNNMSINFQYEDNAVLCVDQNGNEKYFMSLTDIFQKNDFFKSLIEATPVIKNKPKDPYHLNDVQPVKLDGSFWKKGDVFLSLRNKSIIALFRPKTGEILWKKQGPWFKQHDINVENDSIISIFNNNVSSINDRTNSSSNLSNYNFKKNKVNFYANNIFSSQTEGRQTVLYNGDILIESTNKAIYYILDSVGILKNKFYIPYDSDPKYAQYPAWSRVYLKEKNNFIEQ